MGRKAVLLRVASDRIAPCCAAREHLWRRVPPGAAAASDPAATLVDR